MVSGRYAETLPWAARSRELITYFTDKDKKLNGPRAVKTDMAQEGDGVVGCNVMLGGNSATLLLAVGQKAK